MKLNLKSLIALLGLVLLLPSLQAQTTFPRNGVYDEREGLYAFTNATIYTTYNQTIEDATLLIRDGKIEAVGKSVRIPNDAVVLDVEGKYIYPSFIEMYADYGMPEVKSESTSGRSPQFASDKPGAYAWNEALMPEFRAHEHFTVSDKNADTYRKLGFGAVLTHRMDGISRGTSTLVTLGDENEHETILKDEVMHHMSFDKGESSQNYPGSLMGCIALLRQTYMDGEWYENGGMEVEKNISLEAWNEIKDLPVIFEVRDKQEAMRAQKIADEFDRTYIIMGGGDEYQRLDEMKAMNTAFILPVNFPDAYDVEDPFDANLASLGDMKHWEMAPSNPARLTAEDIDIALTTHGLKKKSDFMEAVRKAIDNGLSEEEALRALTHTPAQLTGADDVVGSLETGKVANFLITSGPIFDKGTTIHHNWVGGKPNVLKELDAVPQDIAGTYAMKIGNDNYTLTVKGDSPSMTIQAEGDTTDVKVKSSFQNGLVTMSFTPNGEENVVRLSGSLVDQSMKGSGQLGNGEWVAWMATFDEAPEEEEEERTKESSDDDAMADMGEVTYPFMAYGWSEKPEAETVLITNATVWTNEADGILEETDVLLRDGKIAQIGQNLPRSGATVVDGTGKHLTSGVIDEHSHIAISRGVNECTEVSTAEVRIGDVVDAEDINIYRQLAGGVTTSQLLHGSCNPIGGQSAIIKLRWGYAPEDMKFEEADEYIKFALGENVKRSRYSSNDRFPDTRMGVEQVYVDFFTRAKEYAERKAAKDPTLRPDLELEALVEILNDERFITCHSYVQSEINMLMNLAEEMGFRVNTFTHILEGYKVADKMAEHGAGGSTFSDWWAYKYEVIDAIPYNGALMHEQGVTVAFNSDDSEMARRLNQEAAKAVLYGDVSEEEAWKFVTLNPAKLLHIDDRVGSIKVGKDADVVLWSDHPMSVYAKAEHTYIDGIKFFDRQADMEMQDNIRNERNRLIQKMIAAKNGGARTQPARSRDNKHYHCDTAYDEMRD